MMLPLQPLVWDDQVIRFQKNTLVRFLLDMGPFDMNKLMLVPCSNEEREQFAQLIGYSVDGFHDLSYVSKSMHQRVDRAYRKAMQKKERS